MNEILHAENVDVTELLLDDIVICDGHALSSNSRKTALVDEVGDGLLRRVSPSDVRTNKLQHVEGGLVQLEEHGISNLSQSQELESLAGLGVQGWAIIYMLFKAAMPNMLVLRRISRTDSTDITQDKTDRRDTRIIGNWFVSKDMALLVRLDEESHR